MLFSTLKKSYFRFQVAMDKCLETSDCMKTDEAFSVRLLMLPDKCHNAIYNNKYITQPNIHEFSYW